MGCSSSVEVIIFAEALPYPELASGLTMRGSLLEGLEVGSGGKGVSEPISMSAAPTATGEVKPLLIGSRAKNGIFSMFLNA
jgi:hypothetical protein